MWGVHDATHCYVSEWSQHMQHLQTESESVPNLQTAVLTVQVLASGKYHSENEVSLPVLYGTVWVCLYCSTHQVAWRQLPWPSIQLSVFSCGYQKFLLERSHKWYVGPHFVQAHSPVSTRSSKIRLHNWLRWTCPLHRALSEWGETFFLVCRVINMDLYCCVLYVSPQEGAFLYKYWVTAATEDGSGFATVGLPTESYFVVAETLIINRVCAVSSQALWNWCHREMSNNIISFKVDIQFK